MMFSQVNLIRQIVVVIGNIVAICMYLSPMPTIIGIVKKKSVEKYSPMPRLATLINLHPDSTLIVSVSGIGVVTAIVFLTIFFVFCEHQNQRLVIAVVLAVEAVFVAILAVLVLTLQHTTDQRTFSVGIVCCVFNTIMYIAPLSVMKTVIKTKSLEFMPFWISVAGFLNAGVWISIPNGIGCVFGLVQLILYATYYESTKRIMAERENLPGSIDEVGLSNVSGQTQSTS
ncbi:hypothetical protein EUTSA_v10027282mg [Eutrema salsugineum]|uniref:Bidirectional sugar transporter SWEET n=1 Tax=Eutrema salsugineum TaxID=72664 RepID=V4MKU4_EUTSA|nr:hypothetical protein EUTSA_v10027282mg [Eutrema salsugineum]